MGLGWALLPGPSRSSASGSASTAKKEMAGGGFFFFFFDPCVKRALGKAEGGAVWEGLHVSGPRGAREGWRCRVGLAAGPSSGSMFGPHAARTEVSLENNAKWLPSAQAAVSRGAAVSEQRRGAAVAGRRACKTCTGPACVVENTWGCTSDLCFKRVFGSLESRLSGKCYYVSRI